MLSQKRPTLRYVNKKLWLVLRLTCALLTVVRSFAPIYSHPSRPQTCIAASQTRSCETVSQDQHNELETEDVSNYNKRR